MTTADLQSRVVPTEEFPEHLLSNIFLRRSTDIFCAPHFVEHITQALLYAVDIQAATVILSSDGRYRSREAMERAARILAGNSVRRVLVDKHSSSSAVGCLLRARHSHFAIIFSGGHHPAKEYLGMKVLSPPGIPMRKEVLDKANKIARTLESYHTCENLSVDFEGNVTANYCVSEKPFTVQMVSSAPLYAEVMSQMFHFTSLKNYLKKNSITITVDCSNGVTGPIVLDILRNRLEVPEKNILHKNSLEDFGGLPADPNPSSREDFLEFISENKSDIGIVISPDGSRYLMVGEGGFIVSPSDTLAIIADQSLCIPFFQENPLRVMVCSICTSQAPDKVAKYSSLLCFVDLPGWATFAPAMLPAANNSMVFGEECSAVGVSSCNYSGHKDAVWTLLAWLSILANTRKSIKEVVQEHWKKFGRNILNRL
ncbi:phosphoglucomutase-1-like [Argiope bruennichi]|uniref:phosphoglucomutase-1-like n=1 Tax=Argiope bruennichi TaxID=94029 RepID=UPI002493DD7A|nr:phosphoglucomutase-1-like [Argiope bruennichi]